MSRHAYFWAALAAVLAVAPIARADDTELFVAQTAGNPAAARANILFIIDTSGSMDTELQTQAEWDPAVQFSGCYSSDSIYFGTGTEAPPCASTAYVSKSINRCAAARDAFDRRGQFTGPALGWNNTAQRWEPLAEGAASPYLECQADRGLDGGGSSAALFAANGSSAAWAADDSAEPAWNAQTTLFDGNWLNWHSNPPTVTRTRLEVVQTVVNALVEDLNNVNIGLMHFNRDEGGLVAQAITNIATSRQAMMNAVSSLAPDGFTPLSETLYEAAQYYRGGNVDFGNMGPTRSVAASRLNNAPDGAVYRSPIDAGCQQNFIILLTDGEPTQDDDGPARIQALPGFGALLGSCDGSGDGACLDDLAEYLYRTDASAAQADVQNVVTYTIGFDVDIALLEATARRGGGRYYLADDTGSLTAVLTDLLAGIEERAGTFVAPSIPVSAFNRAETTRDVFVSLFKPTGTAHWPGNLKKYRFTGDQLLDRGDETATDPETGFFEPDITSFWTDEADGDRVAEGGAAGRLPAAMARHLYTDVAGSALTSTDNRVDVATTAITAAVLGVAPEQRDDLIDWIRGKDLADLDGDGNRTEPRRQMGDPLHVRPVTLSYGSSAENPDTVVFIATNDGLLHAIDADTGDERWAYLPGRLLGNQQELFLDTPSPLKRYGLDGEIRLVARNTDGQPGISPDDTAILIFGMGRGGHAVFAVDVSDADAPVVLWQIDASSNRLAAIGQVWAAPAVARVKVGDAERDVVMLSGGYDDAQDNRGYRPDTVGNAMFIIDLETGAVIWSAGPRGQGHDLELDEMNNSIPAAPRVIDLTGDGLADRLYMGDTGGRLWRFDILNGNSAANLVAGGVLAELGAAGLIDPPPGSVRRFYTTPDAVFVNCSRGTFLAINIGSGFRGHPLDTDVQDAFFSVRDPNALGALASDSYGTPIGIDDLQDITDDAEAVVPNDAAGWRLSMVEDDGEKILSAATTFDRLVFFNSFSPVAKVSSCAGGIGLNRRYQVDACNGRPVTNLDGSADSDPLSVEDRFGLLSQAGIAPETVFLFTSGVAAGPTRCIGLVCFPPDPDSKALRGTFWTPEPAR